MDQSRKLEVIEVSRREGEDMYNHSISSLLSTALLSLTPALAPAWAQAPSNFPPAENSGLEKTLTGTVSDAVCKGWHNRKGRTNDSYSLKCVEDGADYVLVVAKTLYILQGHRTELDKFAGGRATVTGRLTGNNLSVDSVAKGKEASQRPRPCRSMIHCATPRRAASITARTGLQLAARGGGH